MLETQCVERIVKAISIDEKAVLPISVYLQGEYDIEDVSLSIPCVVGGDGIEKILEFPLEEEELEQLHESAESLKNTIKEI
jgi:L-lactate dehydrogenase